MITTTDFEKIKHSMEYIILRPKSFAQTIDISTMKKSTVTEFRTILDLVFRRTSLVPLLFWTTIGIIIFGCWDTIATTFFIDFLDQGLQESGVKNIVRSGFVLIGIIAIPAYALQGFWIKKSLSYGRFRLIVLGLAISGASLL